jgi:hypothetical protein
VAIRSALRLGPSFDRSRVVRRIHALIESSIPTADSIEPPIAGGRPPGDIPTSDTSDKVARLDQNRTHG